MELHVGDIVEFKKYEDMDTIEDALLAKASFPSKGIVEEVVESTGYFGVKNFPYYLEPNSIKNILPKKENK